MDWAALLAPAGVACSRQECRIIQLRQPFIDWRVRPWLLLRMCTGHPMRMQTQAVFHADEDQPGGLFHIAQAVRIRSGHLPGAQTGIRPRAI